MTCAGSFFPPNPANEKLPQRAKTFATESAPSSGGSASWNGPAPERCVSFAWFEHGTYDSESARMLSPRLREVFWRAPSEELLDHVHWPGRASFSGADGEHAVQKGILRGGGLEARQRSK